MLPYRAENAMLGFSRPDNTAPGAPSTARRGRNPLLITRGAHLSLWVPNRSLQILHAGHVAQPTRLQVGREGGVTPHIDYLGKGTIQTPVIKGFRSGGGARGRCLWKGS